MKVKFITIVLVLSLPLFIFSVCEASTFGLDDDQSVDVILNIEERVIGEITQQSLFENTLEGAEGLYISDGNQVKGKAQELFNLGGDDVVQHERNNGILLTIQSNFDLNVIVQSNFDWDLNSPNAFFIFEHWAPWEYHGTIYNNHPDYGDKETLTFTHHSGGADDKPFKEYKIGGAVYIKNIADQLAGDYTTQITVTLSAQN